MSRDQEIEGSDVLQRKYKEQEEEIKSLKQKYKEALDAKERAQHKYNTIQKSKIWRYTNPLRLLLNFIKSFIKSFLKLFKRKGSTIKNKLEFVSKEKKKKKGFHQLINRYKQRLYSLGFVERGLIDLKELYEKSDDPYLKSLAAWELAIWYVNQEGKEGAQQCLEYLPKALEGRNEEDLLKKAIVIEAECLERLGQASLAKQVVQEAFEKYGDKETNLLLASANLEETLEGRLAWINKALEVNEISSITLSGDQTKTAYDQLSLPPVSPSGSKDHLPKVTVILPAYNAEELIGTAIDAMLSQTWENLEIFVVDDCSTDNTVSVIEEYEKRDNRVKLLQVHTNSGPYVARNIALKQATGEFVTINDADDWSHPEKIEKQVRHLMDNPAYLGNTSQQARATSDLKFSRRSEPGYYIFKNVSSFMFRREPIMESVGYWDCVRFAADSEYIRRIKKVFGKDTIIDLKTGPLSFQRKSDTSLTANNYFGFPGYFMGARREHLESLFYFFKTAENVRVDYPQESRPFPVPEPMWPKREEKQNGRRHFDVIIVSDFRFEGGSTLSNAEEIKAQKRQGLRTGIVQMFRYDFNPLKKINPKVRQLIDGEQVQMIVYGEKVSCDVLILRYPPILQEWQRYVPDVEAKNICVIINQTPMSDYGPEGVRRYDIRDCEQNLIKHFGKTGTWYPIGPLVRETLINQHAEELSAINLSDEDWSNIIDVEEWKRESRLPRGKTIKIGRHSRGELVKWPIDADEILTLYPESNEYEIHILGGASAPENVLGRIPTNWHVLEFGAVHPKDFLATLDVFVYYTHPDLVEAFGRVIIEAMAVGVPVIIPHHYKKLFGEAAIYAEPKDVPMEINKLMNDDDYYQNQVNKALAYVDRNFGYSKHASRIKLLQGKE
ncbi:glycosyltransferase [Alkalihalobacterium alkalicellulosilyticum]|uniref:glycosyltransferase n=1 Tax=Alkalihalobacterium alkalicellulosilyticum TaxID=1912214 RepID=UPI0009983D1F|nr:glycosyltransferase [Bacillus alkalicellulosilyticus]